MVRKLRLKTLINSLIFLPTLLFAQDWERLETIDLNAIPSALSVDTQQNFYLGFPNGVMIKYDKNGNELHNYSFSNLSEMSSIEAINSLKIFLFYFDNQQITILDRFNTIPKNYLLGDFGIEFGMMACPTPDGAYWVVENNPMRLKKIDLLQQSLLMEVQTKLGDSVKCMRAFQNILIISDENGLHIFDQFGSKLHEIPGIKTSFFQFYGNSLMAFSEAKIHEIDPFGGQIIKEFDPPNPQADYMAILGDVYLFTSGDKLAFYKR